MEDGVFDAYFGSEPYQVHENHPLGGTHISYGAPKSQSGRYFFNAFLFCFYKRGLSPLWEDESALPQRTLIYVRRFFCAIVIITGLKGVPLLLFVFLARMCPVSFIVAGLDPIEDAVSRDGKVQEDGKYQSYITCQGESSSEFTRVLVQ